MAILNYTTTVAAKKTVSEIQEKLSGFGCNRIIIDYDTDRNPSAIQFQVLWDGKNVFFRLPCNHESVLRAMTKSSEVPKRLCNKEQAYRVTWRIIKDWIYAQLAIVEAEQASIQQAFLPYVIHKSGVTLYEELEANNSQLLLG